MSKKFLVVNHTANPVGVPHPVNLTLAGANGGRQKNQVTIVVSDMDAVLLKGPVFRRLKDKRVVSVTELSDTVPTVGEVKPLRGVSRFGYAIDEVGGFTAPEAVASVLTTDRDNTHAFDVASHLNKGTVDDWVPREVPKYTGHTYRMSESDVVTAVDNAEPETTNLSPRDAQALVEVLTTDTPPTPALVEAVARHEESEGKKRKKKFGERKAAEPTATTAAPAATQPADAETPAASSEPATTEEPNDA